MSELEGEDYALRWHLALSKEQRDEVITWLRENPPPKGWEGSPLEWAYTEGPDPRGPFARLLRWFGAIT